MDYLEQLERTKAETLELFDLDEQALAKTYGPGKWTARFVLTHLADSENVFLYRLRRIISQPRQVIWATDQDAWAAALDYSRVPLDLSKRIYSASRDGVSYLAREHYDGSGDIKFVHSEMGLRTLRDEFDKVARHNRQHLEQLRQAISA